MAIAFDITPNFLDLAIVANTACVGIIARGYLSLLKGKANIQRLKQQIHDSIAPLLLSVIASGGIIIALSSRLKKLLLNQIIYTKLLELDSIEQVQGAIQTALMMLAVCMFLHGFKLKNNIKYKQLRLNVVKRTVVLATVFSTLTSVGLLLINHVVFLQQTDFSLNSIISKAFSDASIYLFGFTVSAGVLALIFSQRVISDFDIREDKKTQISRLSAWRYINLYLISLSIFTWIGLAVVSTAI